MIYSDGSSNRTTLGVRETDSVARFGGDEFIVLLTEINSNIDEAYHQARLVADKVRFTCFCTTVYHATPSRRWINTYRYA